MPGADGIKVRGGWAWISVTSRDRVVRSSISADGSAGPLEAAAEQLHADDFAFGASGSLFVATHAAQTVLRLRADGGRETIAGPSEGVAGCTACAFGRGPEDQRSLYVTTTGGLRYPYRGEIEDAKLVRLDVAEAGQPLQGVD